MAAPGALGNGTIRGVMGWAEMGRRAGLSGVGAAGDKAGSRAEIKPLCQPGGYDLGMSAKDNVIAEALKLPEGERLEVAERLWESLEGAADADAAEAWSAEIERRIGEIDAG